MKKVILVAVTLLFISSPAFADQSTLDYVSSDSDYQGSSGTNYQYDLNNPSDNIEYGYDTNAQIRDSLSTDPGRTIDNGLGQYGGGIND